MIDVRNIARRNRCWAGLLALCASLFLVGSLGAGSAMGAATIESFTVASSDTEAGGHPDLSTSFQLADPGSPESARNVEFNAPEGMFGNPNATTQCTAADFALTQCPSDAQAGLVTVRANHEGDPNNLLGTVPMFVMEPASDEPARFAFVVPELGIPINIHGGGAHRERLRPALQGLRDHPGDAPGRGGPHLLGLPGCG